MSTQNDSACRSCHSTVVTTLLDFGPQPPSDLFPAGDDPGPDPSWPLALGQCRHCYLLQLVGEDVPVPEIPLAVESATSKRHATESAHLIVSDLDLPPGTTFTEFDSAHGGSWAPALQDLGMRRQADGCVDLVVDVHGMIHDSDLDAALAVRVSRMGRDARLVVEFHHGLELVRHQQFDTIRHGHPVYLTLTALQPALARHGLHLQRARPSEVYGGSLILTAGREDRADSSIGRILTAEREAGLGDPDRLRSLNDALWSSARALHAWLADRARAGRRVLGYGAPSKAPVLLNLAGVGPDLLGFTVDLSPDKQGRRLPVTRIPIRSPQELLAAAPDDVLIFTWDIADEVRTYLRDLGIGDVDYFVPLPEPTHLM
jgi:hypothetical protein